MALNKLWNDFDPAALKRLPVVTGVFELGDAAGEVVYIGFAGGKTLFGIREEITARLPVGGRYRYEVNMMYMTRFVELLEMHQDATGRIPKGNVAPGEYVPGVVLRRQKRRDEAAQAAR